MVALISVAVYTFFLDMTERNILWSQAAMTTTMVFTLLLMVLFIQPPSPAWVGGGTLNGDKRQLYLVVTLYAVYLLVLLIPSARAFFELKTMPFSGYIILGFVTVGWAVLVRWMWRARVPLRSYSWGLRLAAAMLKGPARRVHRNHGSAGSPID
jgi:hypothetical protein